MNYLTFRKMLAFTIVAAPLIATLTAFAVIGSERYGDNLDSYAMLGSWQQMVADGIYAPSRYQGNLFSELSLGALASVFGPLGANGLSLFLSLLSLVLTYAVLRSVEQDPIRNLLAVSTVASNPFWFNASVTSMDYIHPIPFFLAGAWLLQKRYPMPAAILFALSGGIRISYAPLGLGALCWAWYSEKDQRQRCLLLQSFFVFLVVISLNYLPVFVASHLKLTFIDSSRPTMQGLEGLVGRWGYKLIYLYGLVGTAAVALAFLVSRNRKLVESPDASASRDRFGWVCIAVIAYHLLLFLYIPVRIEYLLPVLIAMAGLFLVQRVNDAFLALVVVSEIAYWFVSVDLLEIRHQSTDPCAPVVAVDASLAPRIVDGVLVRDFESRSKIKEWTCLRNLLVQPPADIRDRLPTPAAKMVPP